MKPMDIISVLGVVLTMQAIFCVTLYAVLRMTLTGKPILQRRETLVDWTNKDEIEDERPKVSKIGRMQ